MPADVRRRAALVYADTVGCMIAGLHEPEVAALAQRLAGHGPVEPLTGLKGSAQNLALVLGFAAAAHELDEGHYGAGGHPAAPAAAAALACAAAGADDATRFAAFVAGYEVGARIGAAGCLRAEAHPHGTWGTVGAAVAAARVAGLDAGALAHIVDLAAGMSFATSVTAPMKGGSIRSAWIGLSARSGVAALDLAAAGVTGEPGAIETTFGSVIGTSFDAARLARGLGVQWEMTANFMKRDGSCRETHGALAGFRSAAAGTPAGDIARIEVVTFADAARLCRADPENAMAARFSIPAVLAAAATDGTIGPDAFADDRLATRAALAARIEVRHDPAATALQPAVRRCRVVVHHADGSVCEATLDAAPGDSSAPLDEQALREKFRDLLAYAGRTDADALFARLVPDHG